jgi:ferredoxin
MKNQKGDIIIMKRKAIVSTRECVACGCCIKVCPRNAIAIPSGICAEIDRERCVGCEKCVKECPASIIKLEVEQV